MNRTALASLILVLLAPLAAHADVLAVKARGGKTTLIGIKDEIGGVPVAWANIGAFLDESNGVIWRVDYDGIEIRKSEKAKSGTTYPWEKVIGYRFSSEPEALIEGYEQQGVRVWAPAIRAFAEVYKDKGQRDVYRLEAYYQIGMCYAAAGSLKSALSHFGKWDDRFPNSKSIYRPEAYRIQAAILTNAKRPDQARAAYAKIEALPQITEQWKLKARLGGVRVDIQERKFDEAIRNARAVAASTTGKELLNDVKALSETLRAKATLAAATKDRFGEARTALQKAAKMSGLTDATSAELYATLGDVIYAQGLPEEARFPYMRVVTMYASQPEQVGHALQNAGQCFMDLHGRALNAGEKTKSDEYLVKGMKLLYECAGRFRGTPAGQRAASAWKAKKKDFEEAEARMGRS